MLRDTLQDEPPFWHRSNPVRSAHNALSSHEAQNCETHTTFNPLSSELCWSAPTERRTWTSSANEPGFAAGVGNSISHSQTTGGAQVKSRFTTRKTRSQGLRTWTTQTHVNSWPASREHWCGHPANHPGKPQRPEHIAKPRRSTI